MDPKIKPWLLEPPKSYLFTNANVIDIRDGTVHANSTIRLAGGRIVSVSPASSSSKRTTTSEAVADAQTVDLSGKFIIPGLIDSHVHIAMAPGEPDPKSTLEVDEHTALLRMTYVCRSILSRGFTTVRDCGGAPMALRAATQEWLVPGPRLVLCGNALAMTGGYGDFRSMNDHAEPKCPSCGRVNEMTLLCDGVDACLKNTRDELRCGADFIKVLGSGGMFRPGDSLARVQFMPEEVSAIAEVARAAGKYVTTHAYTPEAIRHAVRNGARGIEHGNFLDAPTAKYLAEKNASLWSKLLLSGYAALPAMIGSPI
jgi:imidazolonepropionase-like amidohydrolase